MHLERLNNTCIWVCIEVGGRQVVINIFSRGKLKTNIEDDEVPKIHLTTKQWGRAKPNVSRALQIAASKRKRVVAPRVAAGIRTAAGGGNQGRQTAKGKPT